MARCVQRPPRRGSSEIGCTTERMSTSEMRPSASRARYHPSGMNGRAPKIRAACSTASSNGMCSNACSVLWWMNTPIGPCTGRRCAACSMAYASVGRSWSLPATSIATTRASDRRPTAVACRKRVARGGCVVVEADDLERAVVPFVGKQMQALEDRVIDDRGSTEVDDDAAHVVLDGRQLPLEPQPVAEHRRLSHAQH